MSDAGSAPATDPPVHLFQIAFSPATLSAVEPGYAVLDNLGNERPDWYEYWPIRRFLRGAQLDEAAFYGFFSTKFSAKTGLAHAEVVRFVRDRAAAADVLLFSPQPDMGAFFLNVFEQGETFDPGLIDAYAALLAGIGRPAPLRQLVMDSQQVVFSNFFVARPAFWREWLALNEALFVVCEGPDSELRRALCATTTYPGGAERKVFLQERAASFLLATQPRWRSVAHNPFGMAWSASRLRDFPAQAAASDALKRAFLQSGYPEYVAAYSEIRNVIRGGGAGLAS